MGFIGTMRLRVRCFTNMRRRLYTLLTVSLILSTSCLSAVATTQNVHLLFKNGDRLSGILIEEGSDLIQIDSEFLGKLSVKRGSLKKIEKPGEATQAKQTEPENPSAIPPAPSKPRPIRSLFQALTFDDWKKRLEFGMTTQSGRRDKTDFSFRLNMQRRFEKNQYRFQSRYLYGKNRGEKSTDKQNASFLWRRDIAPGVFYQTDTLYSVDEIKEIDLNLEQRLGLGYRFVDTEKFKLSTGAGTGGRLRTDRNMSNAFEYLFDVFEDIDYRVSKRLRLTQDFRIALPLSETDQYLIDFRAAMVTDITESLDLSVRYQLEYDNSLSRDRREDQRLISAIGYSF